MTAAGQGYSIHHYFEEAGKRALAQYGRLMTKRNHNSIYDAASDHFRNCEDELALDFIELLFQVWPQSLLGPMVDEINRIFQDEGIGYELTPLREIDLGEIVNRFEGSGGRRFEYEFPKVIRKDSEYLHKEVVRPCLEALGRPGLETALSEMMKAHEAYRKLQYEDAITDAASAFESTLKTICSKRGWTYNPDKDTLSPLVKACNANSLFPSFYVPIFEAVGTLRNKMSDAHGRGPKPLYTVSKEHADHMIQMTSAHITFLVRLAGI